MEKELSDILLFNKKSYYKLGESDSDTILDECASALNNGNRIIEFTPFESDKLSVEIGRKIRQLCSIFDSLYIVKSRCDIAKLTNANGVILDNDDINIKDAKKIIADDMITGTYYYNNEADFVLSDNIYPDIKYLFIKKKDNLYENDYERNKNNRNIV